MILQRLFRVARRDFESSNSMTKQVLDVGQCVPDHAAIRRLLESNFQVHVVQTDSLAETLDELRRRPFDLVLINRKLDLDYTDGIEILRAMKSDPELAPIPVMLVTNFAEHQQLAIEAGAVPGFGKNDLRSPATLAKLKAILD
jgi:two-component system chemotaxis response regulator CheY